jgi:hypothetical protein
VKARKAAVRALPAFLMLAAVVLLGNLGKTDLERQAEGWGGDPLERILLTPPVSPLTPQEFPCPVAGELLGISEQAATLTGSLALIEKDDRPQAASGAAAHVRALRGRAGGLPGGAELAGALGDLAEALERYAGGDPSAIGDVREACARNAGVRLVLEQQLSSCGGGTNE